MKVYLVMKTLTDFCKTVETGVNPRLNILAKPLAKQNLPIVEST